MNFIYEIDLKLKHLQSTCSLYANTIDDHTWHMLAGGNGHHIPSLCIQGVPALTKHR
jgi:hypothetical protein